MILFTIRQTYRRTPCEFAPHRTAPQPQDLRNLFAPQNPQFPQKSAESAVSAEFYYFLLFFCGCGIKIFPHRRIDQKLRCGAARKKFSAVPQSAGFRSIKILRLRIKNFFRSPQNEFCGLRNEKISAPQKF